MAQKSSNVVVYQVGNEFGVFGVADFAGEREQHLPVGLAVVAGAEDICQRDSAGMMAQLICRLALHRGFGRVLAWKKTPPRAETVVPQK